MVATTKVDYRKAMVKLRRLKKKLALEGNKTVDNLAALGKANAKKIAPYYTGKTAKLIRVIKTIGESGIATATIFSPNPTPNRGGFNLVKWMHITKGKFRSNNIGVIKRSGGRHGHAGQKHIHSGNPQYMYETTRYLKNIKTNVAKGHFDKVKIV